MKLDRGIKMVQVPFEDAVLELRPLACGAIRRLGIASMDIVADGLGGFVDVLDRVRFNLLIGREAVLGWQGITVDNQPFPYSAGACDILMTRSAKFSGFIQRALMGFADGLERRTEARRKNSLLTSAPAAIIRV